MRRSLDQGRALQERACKEKCVPKSLVALPMVAIALTLAACGSQSGSGNGADTASAQRQAQWNEDAIRDLKQAIDSRAVHGLDHLSFAVEGHVAEFQLRLHHWLVARAIPKSSMRSTHWAPPSWISNAG